MRKICDPLPDDAPALLEAAAAVLRTNDRGEFTKPSARLYPHQWNWDSAFIAMGWAHLDWERAVREVASLLRGQWTDGMLPHIRYDRAALGWYAPGPELWPGGHARDADELTSGISQPPVLPTAVYRVGMAHPDRDRRHAWWAEVFDGLLACLRYFCDHRTVEGCPLIVVVHPWESGHDNSPRWDFAVEVGVRPQRPYQRIDNTIIAAAERPTNRDYDLYIFLAELISSADYALPRYLSKTPFAVYDAQFNAIWYRSAQDLNRIAAALGRPEPFSAEVLAAFAHAFRDRHWDAQRRTFLDYDLVGRRPIPVETCASLMPIFAGLVGADEALDLLARYRARSTGCRVLPVVLPDQRGFEAGRYSRGPVWIHTNWMVIQGLASLGCDAEAARLAGETLDLVRQAGYVECYHAASGVTCGPHEFSWSAALVIDLLRGSAS